MSEIVSSLQVGSSPPSLVDRLERLPILSFHRRIGSLLGAGLLLDGYDTLIVAVTLPFLMSVFHVSAVLVGALIGAGYAGQFIGASVTGYLGERLGRKGLYVATLAWFGVFSLLSAFAPTFQQLFLARFIQGLGLGGCAPVAVTLYSEFLPAAQRGKRASRAQIFYALGFTLAPVAALAILPFVPQTIAWRLLFGIGALPIFLAILAALLIPESVRWLESKGRAERAEQIVSHLERQVSHLLCPKEVVPQQAPKGEEAPAHTRFMEIFSRRYWRRTLLIWVQWFAASYVIIGVSTFLPTWYVQISQVSGAFAEVLTIVFGVIALLFLALFTATIDRVGRKRWFLIAFAISAIGALIGIVCLGFYHQTSWIILSTIGIGVSMGSYVAVIGNYLYTTELFPTRMRALSLGMGKSCGSLASIAAPITVGIIVGRNGIESVFLVMFVVAVVALAMVMWLGIETKGQTLETLAP